MLQTLGAVALFILAFLGLTALIDQIIAHFEDKE